MNGSLQATDILDFGDPGVERLVTERGWRELGRASGSAPSTISFGTRSALATTTPTDCRHPGFWPTATGSATRKRTC